MDFNLHYDSSWVDWKPWHLRRILIWGCVCGGGGAGIKPLLSEPLSWKTNFFWNSTLLLHILYDAHYYSDSQTGHFFDTTSFQLFK